MNSSEPRRQRLGDQRRAVGAGRSELIALAQRFDDDGGLAQARTSHVLGDESAGCGTHRPVSLEYRVWLPTP